jgi:hypothetical protein
MQIAENAVRPVHDAEIVDDWSATFVFEERRVMWDATADGMHRCNGA